MDNDIYIIEKKEKAKWIKRGNRIAKNRLKNGKITEYEYNQHMASKLYIRTSIDAEDWYNKVYKNEIRRYKQIPYCEYCPHCNQLAISINNLFDFNNDDSQD